MTSSDHAFRFHGATKPSDAHSQTYALVCQGPVSHVSYAPAGPAHMATSSSELCKNMPGLLSPPDPPRQKLIWHGAIDTEPEMVAVSAVRSDHDQATDVSIEAEPLSFAAD